MNVIVLVTVFLLITILGVYLVVENNRRKAIEAEKRAYNERVRELHRHFKARLAEFAEARIVRPKYLPKLQAIISNFFVVQPHNEENLLHLEKVTDLFLATVTNELKKCQVTGRFDELAEQMQYFVAELPNTGIAFNRAFYHEILPALIVVIRTSDEPLPHVEATKPAEPEAAPEQFIKANTTKAQELVND
ncbi:hypothetical protein ACFOEE_18900 [Pseudoalteromonas fenneropenaei]|uniref:LemA family protein n=1 Tax=Pseudoalteromonas fenneropenaei TaxID=1737459 RepID=A0ABV7CPF2_9GAMM